MPQDVIFLDGTYNFSKSPVFQMTPCPLGLNLFQPDISLYHIPNLNSNHVSDYVQISLSHSRKSARYITMSWWNYIIIPGTAVRTH